MGTHKIQGIGAGFVPEVLNIDLIDRILTVKDEEAIAACLLSARKEAIMIGISSGACCAAGCLRIWIRPSGAGYRC